MKMDPKVFAVFRNCFTLNMFGLLLGIFTEATFMFMLDILILGGLIYYIPFEYRRLNGVGVRFVLFILAALYTAVKILLQFVALGK